MNTLKLLIILVISQFALCTNAMGKLVPKIVLDNDNAPVTVADILKVGKADFDPWNKDRWAAWYNDRGEIIKPFCLNTNILFAASLKIWKPVCSPDFGPTKDLFIIDSQGIVIDGNGITIDITSEEQRLSLKELYSKGRGPWKNGSQLQGFRYRVSKIVGIDSTVLKNITLMGFRRGVKVDGCGDGRNLAEISNHPFLVTNCKFTRNGIGFYTNADSGVLQNCEIVESGNGAIYSGYGSHDNKFVGNIFRDNTISQHQTSYADFIGDTYFNTLIEGNNFLPSLVDVNQRLQGVSIFRNMGESNKLRKNIPHNNIIRNNTFTGYSIAVSIGSRMGRKTSNDVTGEGRDYAFGNLIESNVIRDTDIGIKINTDGNTIKGNRFSNVDNEIVLHCIFFSLKDNTIEYQRSNGVKLWYVLEDYEQYKQWFSYADKLNGSISKSEKRIEVRSKIQSPKFPSVHQDIFVLNPKDNIADGMFEDFRVGLPICTANGELSVGLSGNETAAIWNKKITRVNNTDYYSILIFDSNGTEINRCGLSEKKWGQLAIGHFTFKSSEMEIAAVPAESSDGKYPIYIFTRGYRVPQAILLEENTDPNISISSNENNELVVTFDGK